MRTEQRPARRLLPGLAVVALGVVAAHGAAALVDNLSALTAAVVLGAVLANVGALPPATRPGTRFAARHLLRLGVVLLGFRLAIAEVARLGGPMLLVVVGVVALTLVGTYAAGRRLGLRPAFSLLVAAGFAVCGVSAVAAVQGVVKADEEEVAFAVALVTLCGTLAIAVLPLLQAPLGLGQEAFGQWVGASVHDVGQVVATAGVAGLDALEAAIVVKLSRVVLLGPVVVAIGLGRRRSRPARAVDEARRPLLPGFVIGFVVAVAVRSTGVLPAAALDVIRWVEAVALTAALVGLGADVRVARLRALGGRPLVLGLLSWVLIASAAYAGVAATGA